MPIKLGGGGAVKSIQRGQTIVSSSVNVSISAVDLNKSTVNISVANGQYSRLYDVDSSVSGYEAEGASAISAGGYLSNSSTLRLVKGEGNGSNPTVYWEVIEYA